METQLITFQSRGRIGLIRPDGSGERYLEFDVPGQASWQTGAQFADGRRILLHSFESERTWEGTIQSHVWEYDLAEGRLGRELFTRDRLAPFVVCPLLLPGEERAVIGPIIDKEQRVYTAALDGTDPRPVTRPGDGFAYGVSLSPAGDRLAFHITPYRIWTVDLGGNDRRTVADQDGHLYFGPVWSPDGRWLAYLDCHAPEDPGHDWADLCLGAADGSEHRVVTEGTRHWFGTSYGTPETRGGGSNMTAWAPAGRRITYTRTAPGSRTAWEFQPQRPDTDHFNRDYLPEQARGGSQLCLLEPFTGAITELTPLVEKTWDFRASWSPDGRMMVFTRARIGEPSEVWTMNTDGTGPRLLTRGHAGLGADFGRWLKTA